MEPRMAILLIDGPNPRGPERGGRLATSVENSRYRTPICEGKVQDRGQLRLW